MNEDKTFAEFTALHERKVLTKDFDSLEGEMTELTSRVSSMLGNMGGEELNGVIANIAENLIELQKILVKHDLYEVK